MEMKLELGKAYQILIDCFSEKSWCNYSELQQDPAAEHKDIFVVRDGTKFGLYGMPEVKSSGFFSNLYFPVRFAADKSDAIQLPLPVYYGTEAVEYLKPVNVVLFYDEKDKNVNWLQDRVPNCSSYSVKYASLPHIDLQRCLVVLVVKDQIFRFFLTYYFAQLGISMLSLSDRSDGFRQLPHLCIETSDEFHFFLGKMLKQGGYFRKQATKQARFLEIDSSMRFFSDHAKAS